VPKLRIVSRATALLLAAFASNSVAAGSKLPVVFVSIPPQKFVAEHLAGGDARVEVMLPPGASPATYEPTPRQMASLNEAELYLQIGVPFEGPILAKISGLMPDLEIVDCRRGIPIVPMEGSDDGHGHGPLDPHIWLDPVLMKEVSRTTARALSAIIPSAAAGIQDRLKGLLEEMDATDRRVGARLASSRGRDLLVFHPAYGYFTRRYGLIQVAVEASGKAPSARQLAEIVDRLSDRATPAIFVQPQFSQTAARRVADALGCQVVLLDPLAEDYLENLEAMAERIASAMEGSGD
jgi:zinc transport system substrate-binding protein